MTFKDVLTQIIDWLYENKRLSYRGLKIPCVPGRRRRIPAQRDVSRDTGGYSGTAAREIRPR